MDKNELDRLVFGMSEKKYFEERKWNATKGDIIAYSICFGLGFLFLIVCFLANT